MCHWMMKLPLTNKGNTLMKEESLVQTDLRSLPSFNDL